MLERFCQRPPSTKDRPGPWNSVPKEQAAMGMALESVLEEVRILLADKVVVGCSIQSDLEVLGMLIPSDRVRDIQRVYTQKRCLMPDLRGRGLPDHKGGPYSLKDLSKAVLGLSIQEGPHSTLHDALATMAVWLYYELPCNRGE